jgi:hypothetical protein
MPFQHTQRTHNKRPVSEELEKREKKNHKQGMCFRYIHILLATPMKFCSIYSDNKRKNSQNNRVANIRRPCKRTKSVAINYGQNLVGSYNKALPQRLAMRKCLKVLVRLFTDNLRRHGVCRVILMCRRCRSTPLNFHAHICKGLL